MKAPIIGLAFLTAFIPASSCNRHLPPPPAPADPAPTVQDAGVPAPPLPHSDSYDLACTNLRTLGCDEGNDERCMDRMRAALETHLTKVDVNCIGTAASVAEVRHCGFVRCQ